MIDTDVADSSEQRKVYAVSLVLFVVVHQLYQVVIIMAIDVRKAVVLTDIAGGLAQLFGWETCLYAAQIKLGNQSEGDGISMFDGCLIAREAPSLDCMAESMHQIQCLTDAFLLRIFPYNGLFYSVGDL